MANLTLSIDDKLLQAARVRAVKEGTSVNEVCRKAIEAYAASSGQQRLTRYVKLQAEIDAMPREPVAPVSWKSRDDMYREVLEERHPTLLGKRGRGKA